MIAKDRPPFASQSTQDDPCVYWDHQQAETDDRLSNLRLAKLPIPSSSATPPPLESESQLNTVGTSLLSKPDHPKTSTTKLGLNPIKPTRRSARNLRTTHNISQTDSNHSSTSTSTSEPNKNQNHAPSVNLPPIAGEKLKELCSKLHKKECPIGRFSRKTRSNSHRTRSSTSIKAKQS